MLQSLTAIVKRLSARGLALRSRAKPADARRWLVPAAIVVLGIVVSGWVARSFEEADDALDRAQFEDAVERASDDVERHMTTYIDALRGAASYLAAQGGAVGAPAWHDYVRSLDLDARYPGVNGMGIILPVRSEDVAQFLGTMRQRVADDFAIKGVPNVAESDRVADRHYVITAVEPLERNRPARGLDVASEKSRRLAAEMARDFNQPTLTRPINLIQDDKKRPAFLLYVPSYRIGASLDVATDRRGDFIGWVYAPFIAEHFFRNALASWAATLGVRIEAVATDGEPLQIYENRWAGEVSDRAVTASTTMVLAGERFRLEWTSLAPAGMTGLRRGDWAFAGGILITLLLAALVAVLQSTTRRAEALVAARTKELEESEDRFRQFAEIAADWVWELDRDLRFTVNTAEIAVAGFAGQDVIGHHPWDRFTVDPTLASNDAMRKAFEAHRPFHQVTRGARGADGKTYYARSSGLPLFDSRGEFRGYRGTSLDVTARVEAEQKVKRTAELLEAAGRIQSDYIDATDPRIIFDRILENALALSGSALGFVGEIQHDAAGTPSLTVTALSNIAWDDASAALYRQFESKGLVFRNLDTLFGVVIRDGKPVIGNDPQNDPRRGERPHGHPPLDNFLGVPLFAGAHMVGMIGLANRPGGYDEALIEHLKPFTTVCGTVTASLRGHAERMAAEAELMRSRERLALVLKGGEIAIWDANFVTGSNTIEGDLYKTLGYPEEEYPRDSLSWGALIHPEDAADVEAQIAAVKAGAKETYDTVLRMRAKDGAWHWILVHGRVVERAADGRALRMVGSEIDITEQRAAEDQLRQAQKMEAIGQLTGGIAHDFNNILMILDGYARRILEKQEDWPAVEFSVKQIGHAVEKATGLTAGLLSFSRRRTLKRQVFDIDESVKDMTELLKRAVDERYELLFALDAGGARVNTDAGELGQALLNLVVNARDAMSGKGGTILVGTRRVNVVQRGGSGPATGEYVEVYVQDHGCGMDEQTKRRVFEPFFTTKPQGQGTGLGLAMVYGFCQQSGGDVEIESAIDAGTTITLSLPVTAEEVKPRLTEELKGIPRGKGERILLIEDDEALLNLVKETVSGLGYAVTAASSGFEALELTQDSEFHVDLILSDIVMPGLSGIELSSILGERYPNARVVFMSGYPGRGDRDYGQLPDGACFVQKPVKADELARMLREQLEWVELKEAV